MLFHFFLIVSTLQALPGASTELILANELKDHLSEELEAIPEVKVKLNAKFNGVKFSKCMYNENLYAQEGYYDIVIRGCAYEWSNPDSKIWVYQNCISEILMHDIKEINSVILFKKKLKNILLATTKTKTNRSIIFQFLLQNIGLPKTCSKHIIFALFSYITLTHLTLLRCCSSFSEL